MKKLFITLSIAIISTLILSACGSGSAAVELPTPSSGSGNTVPGTGGTTEATGGATNAAPTTAPTPFITNAFPGIGETAVAPNTPTATSGAAAAGETPAAASGQVYKLSNMLGGEIISADLLKQQGGSAQNIHANAFGAIDSVLVDPQSGAVVYVLMAPGQPLDRPNTVLVAVPFKALQLAPNAEPNSSSKLDVFSTQFDSSAFQNAPGIRDISTFNFREPDFYVQFRKYWSDLGVPVQQVDQNGLLRLSSAKDIYADTDVRSPQGDEVGNVAEVLLDLSQGQVTFLVVSTGGFLGIGENLTVIPWAAFDLAAFRPGEYFVLNADAAKLRGAPGIPNVKGLDTLGDNWQQQYYSYWGVSAP